MSRTDTVADTLTMIRNASMIKRQNADVPYSRLIESILKILKNQGYIEDFKMMEYTLDKNKTHKHRKFRVYLRYIAAKAAITNLKRISKPGRRIYVRSKEVPTVLRGRGLAIISTPSGMLTDEEARNKKMGGEVICYVW